MSEFYALDVETANPDQSSICQIGIAKFSNGVLVDTWSSLINPKASFDSFNVGIHGISKQDVRNAPTFSDVYPKLNELLSNNIILHHGPFDNIAFRRSYDRFSLDPINSIWLDNMKVVRRTWEEFARTGYRLKNLTKHFEIELNHHNALSDSIAAGKVFAKALEKTETTPEYWIERTRKGITDRIYDKKSYAQDGNSEAPFAEENIVFTGELSIPRREAAPRAASIGFNVQNGVTKKTSYLCVGLLDFTRLAGKDKTSKQIKAEKLIASGNHITIISENDFLSLLSEYENQ